MAALTQVRLFLAEILTLLSGVIFPATPTAVSVIAAFGFIATVILFGVSFVKRLASN